MAQVIASHVSSIATRTTRMTTNAVNHLRRWIRKTLDLARRSANFSPLAPLLSFALVSWAATKINHSNCSFRCVIEGSQSKGGGEGGGGEGEAS